MLKRQFFIYGWLLSILTLSTPGIASTPEPFTINILHTNDLHAHDEPFFEHGHSSGGMARISYLANQLQSSLPNTVLVDAGDIFQGTPFFHIYHGAVEVCLLNQCHYDIYTPGNHDLDEGPENLAQQLSKAHFDIVCTNLDASATPALAAIIKPSVIRVFAGVRVAFTGVITPDLANISLKLGKVKVKGTPSTWTQPVQQEVDRLRRQGINKIILISHCGVARDLMLAKSIPELDAIIGGHSHTRIVKPLLIKHSDGSSCLIVQAGCYGRALGDLKLTFDPTGNLIVPWCHHQLINIRGNIPEDIKIKNYLQSVRAPIKSLQEEIAGVALKHFDSHYLPYDSSLGDLVCDALAEEGSKYGATIALQNRGGLRSSIEKGLVSQAKIEEILPFDNTLVCATISGANLLAVLEHGLQDQPRPSFLEVHGLKIIYNPDLPPEQHLVHVWYQSSDGTVKKINPQSSCRITTNSFTFDGGEGYDFSSATNIERTNIRLADVLSSYFHKHGKIAPPPPGRIIPVSPHGH